MKAARGRATELMPWFWGIHGATSVCARVLAIIIAINFGNGEAQALTEARVSPGPGSLLQR